MQERISRCLHLVYDQHVMPNEMQIVNKEKLNYEPAAMFLKKYAGNQRDFFETISKLLEDAIPFESEVMRTGGMFSRKLVQKATVTFKEKRYALEDVGHDCLHAERARVIQGIALKTESIPIEIWVEEIVALITERSKSSISAKKALSRMMKRETGSRNKME